MNLGWNSSLKEAKFPASMLLREIYVHNCALKELDVSALPRLSSLNCDSNKITSLDLNGGEYLLELNCNSNRLEFLDLTKAYDLKWLGISENPLIWLDTSALQNIECESALPCWNNFACAYKKIERTEDGKYIINLSDYGNFDTSKLNIVGWGDAANRPKITEDGIVWNNDPTLGSGMVRVDTTYDLSNGTDALNDVTCTCHFLAMWEEDLDLTYTPIDEEHFPDPKFRELLRNYLGSRYGASDEWMLGMETMLTIDQDVDDLTGIGYFKNLLELDINPGCTTLRMADLRSLKKLICLVTNNEIFSQNLSAIYLDENFPLATWTNPNIPLNATAAEENGRYVIDLDEVICYDADRMFDFSTLGGTLEGHKVYWDSEEDVPPRISYKFVFRENYNPEKEYAPYEYLAVTINISNNAPELPPAELVELSEENFPDANFRQLLADQYDQDGDGYINTTNALYLYAWFNGEQLEANNKKYDLFTSLKGIELLTRLQSISFSHLPITELDLSKNKMLTSVCITDSSLTKLDISECSYLEELNLDGDSMTEVSTGNCKFLRSLSVMNNSLSELDVSKNRFLLYLSLPGNAFTSLDLSKNTALVSLCCWGNQRLTSLDLSKNTALASLDVNDCQKLGSLELPENPKLTHLWFSGGGGYTLPDLETMPTLKYVYAFGVPMSTDWTKLPNLAKLECITAEGVETVDFSKCPKLNELTLFASNNLKTVELSHSNALLKLKIENSGMETLDVSGCTALTDIECTNAKLSKVNLKDVSALKRLILSTNDLGELDVTGCPALQELDCTGNNLSAIDVTGNPALKYLRCSRNPIRSIDLSNNKAMLTDFNCTDSSLTSLDVSANTSLENVDVNGQVVELTDADLTASEDATPGAVEGGESATSGAIEGDGAATSGAIGRAVQTLKVKQAKTVCAAAVSDETEKVYLNLAVYGKFDKEKISDLSSGTLTDTGIAWNSVSEIPDKVTYKYDISNNYKLKDASMTVTLDTKKINKETEPAATSAPTASPTKTPDATPTADPANTPANTATAIPTADPSNTPAADASAAPTTAPTDTPAPTETAVSSPAPTNSDTPGETGEKVDETKKPTVKKVSGVKAVVNAKKRQITLTWKKLSGTAGYRVQLAKKSNFKDAKSYSINKSKTKYIFKKLKKKQKYYIRICAYKTYKNSSGATKKVYGNYVKVTKVIK